MFSIEEKRIGGWGCVGTIQHHTTYTRRYLAALQHTLLQIILSHTASLSLCIPPTLHHIASRHTISLHSSHPILSIPSHHFTSLLLSLPPLSSHPILLGLLNYMFHNIQMRQSELDRYLCYQKRLLRRLKRIEEEKKVVYLIKLAMPDYLFLMGMIDYDSTDQVSFVISLHVKLYNIILYRMNVSPSHTNLFRLQLIQSPILCCPHHSPSSLYTPPLSDTISSSSLLLPILTLSL